MGLQPVARRFVNYVCTIQIKRKFRRFGITRIAIFPRVARETAHNYTIKIWRQMVSNEIWTKILNCTRKPHRLETYGNNVASVVLSCPVLSCPVLSCPVLSSPVLSCSVPFRSVPLQITLEQEITFLVKWL